MTPEQMAAMQAEQMRQYQEQMFRQAHQGAGIPPGCIQVKDIPAQPQQKYAIIAAIESSRGGFSKAGTIPWYYKEDFEWFKEKTMGHPCVMGRKTYEDINNRLGEKAAESVLPGRQCFVVTSKLTELPNATVIPNIRKVEYYTNDPQSPIFIIGGSRIFNEGIAFADELYLTIINNQVDCDLFFPIKYVAKHFNAADVKDSSDAMVKFFLFKRKGVL
jgi:dihydrofolate reductase